MILFAVQFNLVLVFVRVEIKIIFFPVTDDFKHYFVNVQINNGKRALAMNGNKRA